MKITEHTSIPLHLVIAGYAALAAGTAWVLHVDATMEAHGKILMRIEKKLHIEDDVVSDKKLIPEADALPEADASEK